jgi:hypothetical protein
MPCALHKKPETATQQDLKSAIANRQVRNKKCAMSSNILSHC